MKKIIFTSMVFVAAIALALVLAEFALRLIFPSRVRPRQDLTHLSYQFHEGYAISLKSNIRKIYPGSTQIVWRTNAHGFRGPELEDARLRVIVYGDSNIMARFSRLEDTFPFRLEEELEQRLTSSVEVINAGIVGFGPDQSLLRFAGEVDRYEPDVVVFHVFADNDFGDLIRNRLFDLDARGELVATNHPRLPDPILTSGRATDFVSSLILTRAVRRVLEPYWLARCTEREFDVYQSGSAKKFSHFADHYDSDLAFFPECESARVKRALLSGVLRRANDLAEEREVALIVLIQPSIRDITTNSSPNYSDFVKYEGYDRRNLSRFVAEIAEQQGIHFVDLYEPFSRNSPEELFFRGDTHWNEKGQALAAREVAEHVLQNGLVAD